MSFLTALLPILGDAVKSVAGSLFPNPADELKRRELDQTLQRAIIERAGVIEAAAADIVKTEAASSHWLAANWRPLTMVTFVCLIVARFMGYTAPGLTEAEVLKLWDIIYLGLGGYVIGRSVEKVLPNVTQSVGKTLGRR